MFWYDEAGNVIEEEDGSNVNEYLYVGSQRVARIYNLFSPYYYYSDYLGTSRVSSDENGNKCYDADYFPWGDEQNVYVNTCPQNYKFNGKERDPDMGVYDFGARFFQDSIARFYSPDWSATVEPVPYAELNNPQSLNLYTYALDNPLSLRDVDGHLSNSPGQGDTGQPGAAGCRQYNASDPACGPEAQQAQQQQKYDPSKSGPGDPTNPGHPLCQNFIVKKASDQAFMTTTNGAARGGLAEAGFSIDYTNGAITIANKVNSVNGDGTPNQLQITTDANTIAILHTHGNHALPTPSPGDRNPNAQFPDFVRSRSALYVTVPHSASGSPPLNQYIQLQ